MTDSSATTSFQWKEPESLLSSLLAQAKVEAAQAKAQAAHSTISLAVPFDENQGHGSFEVLTNQEKIKKMKEESILLRVKLDAGISGIPTPSSSLAEKSTSSTLVDTFTPALPPALAADPKKKSAQKTETTGSKWFDMPATDITPEIRKDMMILKARGALDPKRHYKKDDRGKGMPKFFQVGTIVTEAADYYSGRLTKKEKKDHIVDELLQDQEKKSYYKKKYLEIQAKKSRFTRKGASSSRNRKNRRN